MNVNYKSKTMINHNKLLENKNVVVSIGGQGIGKAIAVLFAQQGANVFIGARNEKKLACAIKQLKKINSKCDGYCVDYTIKNQAEDFINCAVNKYGDIDILVNVVGINTQKVFHEYTDDKIQEMFDVNVFSYFKLGRIALPIMMKKKSGIVINISSIHGIQTVPNFSVYSATKGAINALTRAMALDYVSSGIRVNTICPGFIKSDTIIEEIESYPKGNERNEFENVLNNLQPMNPGKAEDIAETALFLASDMSSYITGQCLIVDGGATIIAHS